jgi:hypothetical protein
VILTKERIEAAARAAYGAHFHRYQNLMERALKAAFPEAQLPAVRCDACDNGLDSAWAFCPFCGVMLAPPPSEPVSRTAGEAMPSG